jgi:hypothetical protein
VTSIQPELWVDLGAQAVAFYQAAFGAVVLPMICPAARNHQPFGGYE